MGTAGDDVLRGTRRRDVIVGLDGDDKVVARGGDDLVCGGRGNDQILGGGGNDLLLGNAGSDILLGQAGRDELRGGVGMDALAGMAGNDLLRGDASIDLAAYLTASGPVTAHLGRGTARGEGRDSLRGIEGFIGSGFADRLSGDDGLNVFFGAGGADFMIGRGGTDWVFYTLASAGITVDLASGSASGGEGDDTLSSIENAVGSAYDDALLGDDSDNYLDGSEGYDVAYGYGGDNLCYAEEQSDCYVPIPMEGEEPFAKRTPARTATPSTSPTESLAEALATVSGAQPVPKRLAAGTESPPGPPPPTRPSARSASTSVSCPMLQGVAWFNLPRWSGYGFYAYRAYRPFTGHDTWTNSSWLWYGNDGWQVWWNGTWYHVPQTYAVIPGGTSLPVEVAYYYEGTYVDNNGSWYSMGGCNTTAPSFGVYVEY